MAIEVGTVFRFYFAEASKTKRSVVVALVGEHKKFATLLLINTELTDFAKRNPNIRAAQLPLQVQGREDFLEHDSFLSCDYIFTRELRDLQQAVRNNPACILGKMNHADIEKAKGLILASGKFKPYELERFGLWEQDTDDED
jgi:hypothetical protein